MQIKLCFKSYECKLTLGAIKHYHSETGRDLWSDILGYSSVFFETSDLTIANRFSKLTDFMGFERASIVFHTVIRTCDNSISIDEIQDAMFQVGVIPSERDSDMSEPWPIVMMELVNMVNTEMMDFTKKKKPPSIEH